MKKETLEFVNTSSYEGGAWNPTVTGFSSNNDEVKFEIDIYEGAKYNWNKFSNRYPEYSGQRSFFEAFNEAKKETEYESCHCY